MRKAALLLGFLLLPPGASGLARESVTWVIPDPPANDQNQKQAVPRIGDQQTQLLIGWLPQFDHRILASSYTRNFNLMEHGDGYCYADTGRSEEREKIAWFSERGILFPGFRMIVRQGDLAKFAPYRGADGAVDLSLLAGDTGLSGGYTASRLYRDPLRAFVDDPARHVRMEPSVSTPQLINLLRGGRLDFIFALPYEPAYYGGPSGMAAEVTALPIAGVAPSVEVFVACSKGSIGQSVIKAVDALLADDENWRRFLSPMQPWLDEKDFERALRAPRIERRP